jgi:hypothetical protein
MIFKEKFSFAELIMTFSASIKPSSQDPAQAIRSFARLLLYVAL